MATEEYVKLFELRGKTRWRILVRRVIRFCAPIDVQPTGALIGAARRFTGVPTEALQMALPLPATLRDKSRLLAGSNERAAQRRWLEEYRGQLAWDEARGE
jgi:hypothetical protein